MNYTQFANDFCVYPPCEHFYFVIVPTFLVSLIVIIVFILIRSKNG